MSNTHFEPKNLQKYPRMARSQGEVEVINIVDLVVRKKDMLYYVLGAGVVREIGQDPSDHCCGM